MNRDVLVGVMFGYFVLAAVPWTPIGPDNSLEFSLAFEKDKANEYYRLFINQFKSK
jgi:hypothetical protein